ncbi:DUF4442 domain-containing protein [Flavobacterium jumunjinense]
MLRIVLIFNIKLTFIKNTMSAYYFFIFLQKILDMQFTPSKLNAFMFFKLPSAFWSGVRVKNISQEECSTTVKHRWFNQNPFNSMYFAVQAMAAEFTTGALVMLQVKESGKNISMLVANNKCSFTKKAVGRITFKCNQGLLMKETIQKAIDTKEGQTIWLTSIGTNQKGEQVSEMQFEWTLKVRS